MTFTWGDIFVGGQAVNTPFDGGHECPIYHFDHHLTLLETLTIPQEEGWSTGYIQLVEGITIGLDGGLYVAYQVTWDGLIRDRIGKFNPDGSWAGQIVQFEDLWASVGPGAHIFAGRVLTLPSGNLLAMTPFSEDGSVHEFTTGGVVVQAHSGFGTAVSGGGGGTGAIAHVPHQPDRVYGVYDAPVGPPPVREYDLLSETVVTSFAVAEDGGWQYLWFDASHRRRVVLQERDAEDGSAFLFRVRVYDADFSQLAEHELATIPNEVGSDDFLQRAALTLCGEYLYYGRLAEHSLEDRRNFWLYRLGLSGGLSTEVWSQQIPFTSGYAIGRQVFIPKRVEEPCRPRRFVHTQLVRA